MDNIFKTLVATRHQTARALKEQGRRVLGYLCAYGPEELVYAAGLVPVRLFGSRGPYPHAEKHLQGFYCSHARGCLEDALRGEYDYLDGVLMPYACEHTRGAYDAWRENVPTSFARFLDFPSVTDREGSVRFLVSELERLAESLERAFGTRVTESTLRDAIAVHNENRALLRELYDLRHAPEPVVTGAEILAATLSSMLYPKEEHNRLLREFLSEVKVRAAPAGDRTRLLVLGTELDDLALLEKLEEQGAVVVADDLCTGSRYIWADVDTRSSPLEAIARRYLTGINCPVRRPADNRFGHIAGLIRDFKPEKALVWHMQCCDPIEWDLPHLERMLAEAGLPCRTLVVGGGPASEQAARVARALEELRAT